ncbi:MAG: PEP-CTERM sorting domain-containing protein, partial [Pirellulales bacterium]
NFEQDAQVDAIANRGDHLFSQTLGSAAAPDRAHLVFSHDDEISVYFGGGPPVAGGFTKVDLGPARAGGPFIVSGKAIGGTGEISYEKATAFSPPSTMGVWATQSDINGMPNPDDIDGLELWGPEPAFKADAEKYSLEVDFQSGVSIWSYDIPTAVSTPYVSHAQIVNAVTALLGPVPGGAVLPYPTFIDGNNAIDLDALMVQDIVDDGAGPDTFDRNPGAVGDRIVFSIRQIVNPNDPDGYYATGSEIFVLDASQPNNPQYLFHGGHLWDQTYALANFVITPNYLDGGYGVMDLNALEAISEGVVPEPATASLLLVTGLALATMRRRT